MLGLPPTVRIHFAVGLVDMRKGIDGLRTIVDGVLKRDPFEGHLFVFVGKSQDKVKILFWDRNGFVVYMKRLEQGRFQLPTVGAGKAHIEMEPAHLAMFLDGMYPFGEPRQDAGAGSAASSSTWGTARRSRSSSPRSR